ncbi:MAG: Panacea domain-containing protein [Acidobacteriaceae bacterium]
MKHTNASDIAKYFIASFQKKGNEIGNLKMQKLLYYAQAWHLALYDAPLFDDKIEAWVHGPVVRGVFREYKPSGWNPLSVHGPIPIFSDEVNSHLKEVVRVYGKFDAVDLERMTHREDPWRDARGDLAPDEPSNRVITPEAMKKFYGAWPHG